MAVSASSVTVAELAMARIVAVSAVLAFNATVAESAISAMTTGAVISVVSLTTGEANDHSGSNNEKSVVGKAIRFRER